MRTVKLYYDRQGKPLPDVYEWLRLFNDPTYQTVGRTYGYLKGHLRKRAVVSTVWLGLDHGIGGSRPTLFETMIFPLKKGEIDTAHPLYETYYQTEMEASLGHVRAANSFLRVIDDEE